LLHIAQIVLLILWIVTVECPDET